MSRTTQYHGLHPDAELWLQNLTRRTENDNHNGDNIGMFDEDVPMKSYVDDKGEIWDEFCQAMPWSGGPVIFTALKNRQTGEVKFAWTQDEILYHT